MKISFSQFQTEFSGLRLTNEDLKNDLRDLCRTEYKQNSYFLDGDFITNGRTAQIKKDVLIATLACIYKIKPFNKLVFVNHYHEGTEEEILKAVLEKVEQKL